MSNDLEKVILKFSIKVFIDQFARAFDLFEQGLGKTVDGGW
jgi:hypothetical protein